MKKKALDSYELCCVGHIAKDRIINPRSTYYLEGGTSFYLSNTVSIFDDMTYRLFTIVGEAESRVIDKMAELDIDISFEKCETSVFFENIYGDDPDIRTQRVLSKAAPFTVDFLRDVNADIIHLGALLSDDFSPEVIKFLAGRGKLSIDSQGVLRNVKETNVIPVDWKEKKELFQYIHFLKANEYEMKTLTETNNIVEAANRIYDWGVKEIIITLGASGSVIYNGKEFHIIPAYKVTSAVDATGCGDTFMGGYLYKRVKGESIDAAAHFGASMASLKIQRPGPFTGTLADIDECMETYTKVYPTITV